MNRPNLKTANDTLVDDPDAAMRKTIQVARQALTVPKAKIDAMMAKEKTGKRKHK